MRKNRILLLFAVILSLTLSACVDSTPTPYHSYNTPTPASAKKAVNNLSWSPDGNFLAAVSSSQVTLWRKGGKLWATLSNPTGGVRSFAWSPDGKTIATGSAGLTGNPAATDGTITLWTKDGISLATLSGHSDVVTTLSWSPDGRVLASGSYDCTLRLWGADGKPLLTEKDPDDAIFRVAWSPDGKILASSAGGYSGKVPLLWTRDGKLFAQLTGHSEIVQHLAWSPDSKTLATGGESVHLWSDSGTLSGELSPQNSPINDLKWSPDGKMLAAASVNNFVQVWDSNGKVVFNARGRIMDWSFDGKVLATAEQKYLATDASVYNRVNLWSLNGKPLATLQGHSGDITDLAWSPNEKVLATSSTDGTVRLWDETGQLLGVPLMDQLPHTVDISKWNSVSDGTATYFGMPHIGTGPAHPAELFPALLSVLMVVLLCSAIAAMVGLFSIFTRNVLQTLAISILPLGLLMFGFVQLGKEFNAQVNIRTEGGMTGNPIGEIPLVAGAWEGRLVGVVLLAVLAGLCISSGVFLFQRKKF